MKKKVVIEVTFIFFAVSMLTLALNNQPAEASGTIYIRADGSIDPLTANITTFDNITYAFTGNINESIVIERDNIVVDGAGYTLQGTGNGNGFDLTNVDNVTIKEVSIKNFANGIHLYNSHGNTIFKNNITNNEQNGVNLWIFSNNNTVLGNNVDNNGQFGIFLYVSCYNNTLSGNNVTDNYWGICLRSVSNTVLRNNNMSGNWWNFGINPFALSNFMNDVDSSNTVDDKPIYYWINHKNEQVPSDAGYVALVNSNNITVKDLELTNNGQGIIIANTTNSLIEYNNLTNNNEDGIGIWYSFNNTAYGNRITNNIWGIRLQFSSNTLLRNNTMTANGHDFRVWGTELLHFIHNIDVSNTADGKAIYYLINQNNLIINSSTHPDIGYLALINSTKATVEGLKLEDKWQGILLASTNGTTITRNNMTNNDYAIDIYFSTNNTISENKITNNVRGIQLSSSFNNSVTQNKITDNEFGPILSGSSSNIIHLNDVANNRYGFRISSSSSNKIYNNNLTCNQYGIWISSSSSNRIYHNNFVNNTEQVWSSGSNNAWTNGYPSGGNYWSDFTGVDVKNGPSQDQPGSDGIGDTPYVIDENNQDYYPLMNSWTQVDMMPPVIHIISPENMTYTTASIPLGFTIYDPIYTSPISWIGYSLDNQVNVTIVGNTTLTGLALGPHNVIIYANDTYGNMGLSDKVYFTRILNDVAVLNVTASPTETYVNQTVNINVTVKNKGTVSETFNVTAYYDSNLIDTQSIIDLAPDSNITITFSWNTSGVQKGTYTISAEAEVIPGETNTTDNTYIDNTVTILNSPPTIDSFTPTDTTPEVNEDDSLEFTHTSSDPDDDALTYSWLLDSVEQSTTQNWTYLPSYDDAGQHNVTLVVSDGELTDSQQWNVTVVNVNRSPVIDTSYPSTDPTISEGESQGFNVAYSDPDGDFTTVQWYLNGTPTVTTDSYTFIADYASAGIYNVTAIVSDGLSQTSHQWMLMVTNVERDIAIINVIPSKNIVGEGYSVSINVTITNQGELAETFNVTVYANTTIIATLTNITLTSGNSTAITFTWNTTGFAKGKYTIWAYAWPVQGETHTTDNMLVAPTVIHVVMPGDADLDKVITILDVVKVTSRYAAKKGDQNYDANVDWNDDGKIDILDVVIVTSRYAQKDP